MPSVSQCEFDWHFPHSRARVWPLLADTQRWNEASGFHRHALHEEAQADGSVRVFGRLHLLGRDFEWAELPLDWVHEQWFEHRRRFARGPLRQISARITLSDENGGCRAHYQLDIETRNAAGRLLAQLLLRRLRPRYATLLQQLQRHLDGHSAQIFEHQPELPEDARSLATQRAASIESSPYGQGMAQRLAEHLLSAQESDLQPLRPLQMAEHWGSPPQATIELFLQATVSGLLGAHWVLLCPRCRVAKVSADNLHSLPEGAHCSSCNIDYGRDFAENVELAFYPAPAIRPLGQGEFCWMGPMSTPHVLAQLRLEPGEQRTLPGDWRHGHYRVRSLSPGAEQPFELDGSAPPRLRWQGDSISVEPGSELSLENASEQAQSLIIESRDWLGDVLTARRVSALQAFRELFSTQTLRPGDQLAIGRMSFLFTDLAGSTALYERIGDASAYHVVREHFSLLGGIIREHGGGIVKTVGDGVHAVFERPDRALAAALAMQRAMPGFRQQIGQPELGLRIGGHCGECLSVSLNGRLDYYGSAVNLAARLEGQCAEEEVVLSDEMHADPALAGPLSRCQVTPFSAQLKGIEHPVSCYRVRELPA